MQWSGRSSHLKKDGLKTQFSGQNMLFKRISELEILEIAIVFMGIDFV